VRRAAWAFAAGVPGSIALAALCALTAYAGPAPGPEEAPFGRWIDPSEIPEDTIVFVAEGRIGNAAGVGAPTERELVLGRSTASPEATADLAWANGSPWRSL
jgi:nitrous oxide reductase